MTFHEIIGNDCELIVQSPQKKQESKCEN